MSMRLTLLALLVTGHASMSEGAVASVRVVDHAWRPLPGASVSITSTPSCLSEPPVGAPSRFTGPDGLVELGAVSAAFVWLQAEHSGGFESFFQCYELAQGTGAQDRIFFQAQLRLDPMQPAEVFESGPGGTSRRRTRLEVSAFAGVFSDASGQYYVVRSNSPDELSVACPDGRVLYFRRQGELVFRGKSGTISFGLSKGVVATMAMRPDEVRSRKVRSG